MEVTPTIVDLRKMADEICRVELEKTLGKLKNVGPGEQKSIEKMASAIVSKMLHNPMQFLKADTTNQGVPRRGRINTVRDIFHLNENSDADTDKDY